MNIAKPSKGLFDVSRETVRRLEHYLAETRKWSAKINLISSSSQEDAWQRHIVDSAQLWRLCQKTSGTWLDLGSGGGFPALVNAVIALEQAPDLKFLCVESDGRKSVFLQKIIQTYGLNATVLNARIQDISPVSADIVSARAFSPLAQIFKVAFDHINSGTVFLLPKGRTYHDELTESQKGWSFEYEAVPSITNAESAVLVVKDLKRG
ncbi:MAG: 16S rRNA (guanine(527)-N(7))-methyltransferase RsmG [Pseudomonadota bacterium]